MSVLALKPATADRTRMVADALEEEIVLGWLLPRERLIEEDIAARLEVKRHVVREALAELERVGLVERVPNKGAAVRLLEPQEVRQIYSVREALETLAAEQIPLPAGSEIVSRLQAIQDVHAAAVAAADARAAFRANMAFHETLFAACGNAHLAELMMAQKVHGARSIRAGPPASGAGLRRALGEDRSARGRRPGEAGPALPRPSRPLARRIYRRRGAEAGPRSGAIGGLWPGGG